MEYFRYYWSVRRYWSIMERKTGLAEPRRRMHAVQPAIKIIEVIKSRRREYHPKTPMVTWLAHVVLLTNLKL